MYLPLYFVTPILHSLLPQSLGMALGGLESVTNQTSSAVHHLQRRSLALLCYQMDQILGPTCLEYIGYGCFCGAGGHRNPVDEVDSCCYRHDNCYNQAQCRHIWYSYFVHYEVKCYKGQCKCSDDEISSPCSYSTCQCDTEFAECLKTAPSMSSKYKRYNRKNC
ncbi:hypothetical protein Btru_037275 [Bulinus truncatus]|nr:hypothetical protein Btru_037275 [Bulinus truncatus]